MRELTGKLAPFEAWTGSKAGQAVEPLGIPRLQEILAVNAQARINIPFGASLTGVAHIPTNAERDLRDLYAVSNTKRNIWVLVILVAVLGGLWMFGKLDPVLPEFMERATVIGPIEQPAVETTTEG